MTFHSRLLAGLAGLALLVGAAEARELRFGVQENEASNVYKGMQTFAARVTDLSKGALTVKLFPSATLGDFKAMVAQVQANELEMVATGYPDMSYAIPELKLIGAPYVVRDFAHLEKVVAGPWGQKMAAAFEKRGIHVIDVWYLGTRVTTSNKPINSIADMKGLRLRTPNVPFLIAFAKNVGATPAPVAFQEVYLALQTNQVDAEENPLPTIEAMKFYEVQKYIAMTNHFVASQAVQISKTLWDGLSKDEKAWIEQAVKEGGEVCDKLTVQSETDLIAGFKARGLTITTPDLAPFRKAMQPYYDELEAEFGKGAIAKVTAD